MNAAQHLPEVEQSIATTNETIAEALDVIDATQAEAAEAYELLELARENRTRLLALRDRMTQRRESLAVTL